MKLAIRDSIWQSVPREKLHFEPMAVLDVAYTITVEPTPEDPSVIPQPFPLTLKTWTVGSSVRKAMRAWIASHPDIPSPVFTVLDQPPPKRPHLGRVPTMGKKAYSRFGPR